MANTPSVAALAIAAHELGHAMQDSEGYLPMQLRSALGARRQYRLEPGLDPDHHWPDLPIDQLAWLGVIAFAAGAVFALATLPVEFNASAARQADAG